MNILTFAAFCILSVFPPKTPTWHGGMWQEKWPAVTVEAGIERGKARAATLWGEVPGSGFLLQCYEGDRSQIGSAVPAPGHAGLHWEWK